eukprot:2615507-Ditylum_brightwellii.AAC.1
MILDEEGEKFVIGRKSGVSELRDWEESRSLIGPSSTTAGGGYGAQPSSQPLSNSQQGIVVKNYVV